MFKRIEQDGSETGQKLTFEEREIAFRAGDSLAAALLAAGIGAFRQSPADGSVRGPYCMMGVCFECLVEVDGRQNQQACLTQAQAGMVVRRQSGARQLP